MNETQIRQAIVEVQDRPEPDAGAYYRNKSDEARLWRRLVNLLKDEGAPAAEVKAAERALEYAEYVGD